MAPEISGDLFNSLIASARELGISPGTGALVFLFLLAVAVMGSALWTGAIAEAKGRSRLLHLLPGLALPYLYPALLLQMLKPKLLAVEPGEAERAAEGELPESRVESAGLPPGQSGLGIEDSQVLNITKFDQQTFRSATFNEHGEARGPFYFELADGTTFCASRIVDTLPGVLLLELEDEFGNVKKLRVPYSRVASCATVPGHRGKGIEEPDWDGGTETIAIRLPDDTVETREVPIPHDIIDTQEVDVQSRTRR